MAFCNKCGTQLQGDERFCVSCGADVSAEAASTGAPASAPPAPVPPRPVTPVQPAAVPGPYPAQGQAPGPIPGHIPGQIPIVMGMPPAAPAKRGWMWVVAIAVVLVVLYYIGKNNPPASKQQPVQGQQQGQDQQPGQGQQPAQGQQQAPSQPGVYPEQQPGNPRQSGNNPALVRMQMFGGRWDGVNGSIQISQARWTNNANVVVQSATLECVQFAANGAVLTQQETTLNGPVQPQATSNYGAFQMGSMAPNLARVTCGIVGVTPASQ